MLCVIKTTATDDGWEVAYEASGLGLTPRVMGRCAAPHAFPLPPADEANRWQGQVHEELCTDAAGDRIARVYRRILRNSTDREEIASFGRYLSDVLLGPRLDALVAAAGEATIELQVDAGDAATARLPWEMAFRGDRPLAAQLEHKVAITRVVRPRQAAPVVEAQAQPLRVLFVVGRQIDRQLRPGAELFGLLESLKIPKDPTFEEFCGAQLAVTYLGEATLEELEAQVRRLRPAVVHFVCHGELEPEGDGCRLLLSQWEDDDALAETRKKSTEPYRCGADRLLDLLRAGDGRLVPVVVLNACHTADVVAAGDDAGADDRIGESESYQSLAADLVAGGVPMVLGMTGEVADRACRIFTLRFYQTLVAGGSVVEAAARARRAAYLGFPDQHDSVEWTRPVLYRRAGLSSTVPLLPPGRDLRSLADRYRKVGTFPEILCDRYDALRVVDEIIDRADNPGDRSQVYAYVVRNPNGGVGKTRMLEEIARRSVYERSVSCIVRSYKDVDAPSSLVELAWQLAREMEETRQLFLANSPRPWTGLYQLLFALMEIAPHPDSAVLLRADKTKLFQRIVELRQDQNLPELSFGDFRDTLAEDFQGLLADVRTETGEAHRPLVLLDDLHRYAGVAGKLISETRGEGLGTNALPIPLVFTYMTSTDEGKEIQKQLKERKDVCQRDLMAFVEEDEWRMVYNQLLLSGWAKVKSPLKDRRERCDNLLLSIYKYTDQGLAERFHSKRDVIDALVDVYYTNKDLVDADFEDVLRREVRGQL